MGKALIRAGITDPSAAFQAAGFVAGSKGYDLPPTREELIAFGLEGQVGVAWRGPEHLAAIIAQSPRAVDPSWLQALRNAGGDVADAFHGHQYAGPRQDHGAKASL